MKIYIYDHCPYCMRVLMFLGIKNIACDIDVLLNDDEQTPNQLIGKKIVPILEKEDGTAIGESLDIIQYLDSLPQSKVLLADQNKELPEPLAACIESINSAARYLTHPRFVMLPVGEFTTENAREYFQQKKEKGLGKSFADCIKDTDAYIEQLMPALHELNGLLTGDGFINREFSWADIMLFPVLRSLTCVESLIFPENVKNYVNYVANACQVQLYQDWAVAEA